ncbi:MAG: DUF1294 domain-containing protein [Oscillospiraceae bacterium]
MGGEYRLVYLSVYVLIWSAAALAICGADKRRAIQHKWRIPEKVLFGVSAAGGAPGFLLGMAVFRHKTRHWSFKLGIPALCILWAGAFYLVWRYAG